MKNVVIVSYYFPPYNGVGGLRSYFLSEFLINNGFSVTVLKGQDKYYGENIDKNICKLDKQIKIKNVNTSQSFINRYLLNYFKFKNAIQKIVEENEISLIIFSGGPFYYFPLGRYFKKHYSIPYILDYRDNIFKKSETVPEYLYKKIFKTSWDKPSLKDSSYIINVTDQLSKLHKAQNPKIEENKFITIMNGYNDILLKENIKKQIKKDKKEDILQVGIFGKFDCYSRQNTETLIAALKTLNFKVVIHQIGRREEGFINLIRENNLEDNFKFWGYQEYIKGLQILNYLDCLLLNVRERYELGTKIFDYIYLNKPIIAFSPEQGEVNKVLEEFKYGFCLSKNDPRKLAKILHKISNTKNKFLTTNKRNLEKYSRTYQFKRLLEKINKIL